MFGMKKNISKSRIQKWSEKGEVQKLLDALDKGSVQTKVYAIESLVIHNFMNVKRSLGYALDSEDKEVSLKAAQAIEHMGANLEEQEKIKQVKAKWSE